MSKHWNPRKESVELRPSRIRRDPPLPDRSADPDRKLYWRSDEWEIRFAIIGIVAFALAIDVIIVAISAYWN